MNERRQWIIAFAVFLALFQICYWTKPGVMESEDFIKFYQPNLHFLIDSLSHGEIPWWNPHIGLGRPFVSDIQNAFFYPPTYLFVFGMAAGLYLILALHLFGALIGMRRLVRSFGVDGVVAWMAGFVLVFSGPFASLLYRGMIFYVLGLCYLPWLLWLVLRFDDRWRTKQAAAFGVLLALQFLTGHPQTFWIGLVGIGLFVLAWKLFERQPKGVLMPAAQMLGGIALAALLTAVSWLPFLDLVAEGNRSGATVEQAGFGTARWLYLFSLFRIPPAEFVVNSAGNWFIGVVWTLAGVVGWITSRDARVRALIVVGLFGLAFSFGTKTYLYGLCFDLLPGTSVFRFPIRMAVWLPLGLLVAGAVFLGRKEWDTREKWFAAVAFMSLLWLPLLAGGELQPLLQSMAFLAAGSLAVCFRMRWPWALGLLLAIELVVTNAFYRRSYSMEGRYGMDPTYEAAGAIERLLASRPPNLPPARACLPPMVVPRNFGMMLGYANFDAYTSLFLKRPWDALHAAAGADAGNVLNTTLGDEIYRDGPFGIPGVSIDFGVDPRQQRFVVNPNPLPRAHLQDAKGNTPVPFERFAASELRLRCSPDAPAMLVLNEAWFPGWRATVNGRETEVTPVNQWMRAVPLGVGEQEVVLKFRPRRLLPGGVLTMTGLVVAFACFRREFRSRPDRAHPSGDSPVPENDR